jgi:hypothetical protein
MNKIYYRAYAMRAQYAQFAQPMYIGLWAAFALAVVAYIGFTFSAIALEFHHGKTAAAIKSSQANIARLETERAAISRNIDLDRAHELGFVDATPTRYATLEARKTTALR